MGPSARLLLRAWAKEKGGIGQAVELNIRGWEAGVKRESPLSPCNLLPGVQRDKLFTPQKIKRVTSSCKTSTGITKRGQKLKYRQQEENIHNTSKIFAVVEMGIWMESCFDGLHQLQLGS